MKSGPAKLASRYLEARRSQPLNEAFIKALRKDFLLLMKNVKIVKTDGQFQEWDKMLLDWKNRFYELVDQKVRKFMGDLPLNYTVSRDQVNDRYTEFRKGIWDLYLNLRVPHDRSQLKAWEGKVRRSSQQAWKAFAALQAWVQDLTGSAPSVDIVEDEQTSIEGFQVTIRGYNPVEDMDEVGLLRAALRLYKTRAQKVYPWLIQYQVPLILDFTMGALGAGGSYNQQTKTIRINPHSAKSPKNLAHFLAHEMGHHRFKFLSADAVKAWSAFITGNYGSMDLEALVRRLAPDAYLDDNESLRASDPILYLQIQGLYEGDGLFKVEDLRTVKDLQEYLQEGGKKTVQVHGKPITGYASKNDEEAFCEALGMLVGYGPQAVLPEVRQWLQVVLPRIRVAKLASRWLNVQE